MSTQRRNGQVVGGKGGRADSRSENGSSEALGKRDVKDAVSEVGPSFVAASMMLGLIFGGCCSNVSTLEMRPVGESVLTPTKGLRIGSYDQVSLPIHKFF